VKVEEEGNICAAAETMITLAFELAGTAANTIPAGLQVFRADLQALCGPAMLSSLPARSIQSLELTMTATQLAAPSMARIFQHLSNLQRLVIDVKGSRANRDGDGQVDEPQLPAAFSTSTLSGLSNLKYLELNNTLHSNAGHAKCLLDIRHLTSLQRLRVRMYDGISEGSSLPESLLAAKFSFTPIPADACSFLCPLQQLELFILQPQSSSLILQLSSLKCLQVLRLDYEDLLPALVDAEAWGSLPQLRALRVHNAIEYGSYEDYQGILECAARVTKLTRLELSLPLQEPEVPCGVHIAKLQNLQELKLFRGQVKQAGHAAPWETDAALGTGSDLLWH
jgi:hypothetical protein